MFRSNETAFTGAAAAVVEERTRLMPIVDAKTKAIAAAAARGTLVDH